MQNLRQPDEQKVQNLNTLILKNLFNIHFRMGVTHFRGANNNQYYFSNIENTILFGYLQFVLNGQLKRLKKYMMPGERIIILGKSEDCLLIYSLKLELWKFDHFQNCGVYQKIYEFDELLLQDTWDDYMIDEIGINSDENILVFQVLKEIFIFYKNLKGFWNLKQTILSDYYYLRHSRFNQSNDIFVAYQSRSLEFTIGQLYLMIFHKNQNGIWQNTYQVQESYYHYQPFCFIDNQQFFLFHFDKKLQMIYEISKSDQKAYIKTTQGIEHRKCKNHPSIIEIQSKTLFLLNSQLFFYIKETNSFRLRLQFDNWFEQDQAKNWEFLFCSHLRTIQIFNIYIK